MKIVLTGGSGFIGSRVIENLTFAGHSVILLSRNPSAINVSRWNSVQGREWDGTTLGGWATDIDGSDAIVNLAGEPIAAKRWTSQQKKRILDSRVKGARVIVEAIRRAKKKPAVLINGSAVGYYGSVENGEVTEEHGRGEGFLPMVCGQWENEARTAESLGVRVVLLRNGVVLGEGGGALEKMIPPFKLFVGGSLGTGRQWFPWIHRDDVVNIILFAIHNTALSGAVNCAAPNSVTMKDFCAALGKVLHRPSWAHVPGVVLKLLLGEMSEMLLTGQRVVPEKLNANGYTFRFPELDDALSDIFS